MSRFGANWRVLFAQLVMFGFVYPGRRQSIPAWVVDSMTARFLAERDSSDGVCNGTLLSREQYAYDLKDLAYHDARLEPRGSLTNGEVALWSADLADVEGVGRRLED